MQPATRNPLLSPWEAPHGLPPFADTRPEHFAPAFEQALAEQRAEIEAIAGSEEPPTFDNTIAAFDRSGRLLARLEGFFFNLTSSETSSALQAVERALAPVLAAHVNAVRMHAGLFRRIDALHRQRETLDLSAEQRRLLGRIHLDFVRAGACLEPAAQRRYAQVTERLAALTTRFTQNVLADEAVDHLVLHGEADLVGLPEFVRAAARQAAIDRGIGDGWVVTLSRSHVVPFLAFSDRRDLRERAWRAWVTRGEHDGPHDNRPLAREILTLRNEQARLHGYACFADYALVDTMAGRIAAVRDLLTTVWDRARVRAERERAALQAVVASRGESFDIADWDWRYYAEKVRQQAYQLDEAEVKPYFPLDRMVEAVFDCAQRLFGLRFVAQPHLPLYHPDVKAYEVHDADERVIGLFLHDNIARPSKRSGAWMSAYRLQSRNGADGAAVSPIVVNNNNFARGAPGEPTLLSFDDARTLFHEFGHALHGLLSDVTYERLSGTAVLRDFVELPSQLFEHWLSEPAVLKRHARHCVTGEPISDALIQRLQAARHFNQGYETVRYTASALLDLAVHSLTDAQAPDLAEFEAGELERIGMPPGIGMNHRLPHFQHLFAGTGYASAYYVYLWAEVLDADGFDAFREAGDPFDAQVAARLRRYIYSSGNSMEPARAFEAFRGRPPAVEAMLRKKGLLDAPVPD